VRLAATESRWPAEAANPRSGADVFPLQLPRLAIGGPLAVIGFLQFAMGLGHDRDLVQFNRETLYYRDHAESCYPRQPLEIGVSLGHFCAQEAGQSG
jgi:hypothetical protein